MQVSFTSLPFYSWGYNPQYPLGGPQNQSGHYGGKKNLLPLLGIEPMSSSQILGRFILTLSTSLKHCLYRGFHNINTGIMGFSLEDPLFCIQATPQI
jgi:hypothetical protein